MDFFPEWFMDNLIITNVLINASNIKKDEKINILLNYIKDSQTYNKTDIDYSKIDDKKKYPLISRFINNEYVSLFFSGLEIKDYDFYVKGDEDFIENYKFPLEVKYNLPLMNTMIFPYKIDFLNIIDITHIGKDLTQKRKQEIVEKFKKMGLETKTLTRAKANDINSIKVNELKEIAGILGLPTTGKKSYLFEIIMKELDI